MKNVSVKIVLSCMILCMGVWFLCSNPAKQTSNPPVSILNLLPNDSSIAHLKIDTNSVCYMGYANDSFSLRRIIDGGDGNYIRRKMIDAFFRGYLYNDTAAFCAEIFNQTLPDSARSVFKFYAPSLVNKSTIPVGDTAILSFSDVAEIVMVKKNYFVRVKGPLDQSPFLQSLAQHIANRISF